MPTPPRESMGGTKSHQIVDFEFHKVQFEYLKELENFKNTSDFELLTENELINYEENLTNQTNSYELLRTIVEEY